MDFCINTVRFWNGRRGNFCFDCCKKIFRYIEDSKNRKGLGKAAGLSNLPRQIYMSCNLYILENNKGKHYVGITKLDPTRRLLRHNRGEVYSTKFGTPWHIVYFQKYKDYKEARQKEKQIKNWHSGATLKRFLSKTAGSSNGRTHASGAWYLGSSPSPAALLRKKT